MASTPRDGDTRIGISGWTYAPWRGTFYPKDLTQKRELEYASRQFNTIEINGTHYAMQKPASFKLWHDTVPDDFIFSVKAGRFITHMRRLRDVELPLSNFFASGLLALGKKLGPILWQFPPNFQFDAERFQTFFDLLPRTHREAAKMAQQHEAWMRKRSFVDPLVDQPIRHAVEIRHESFRSDAFVKLLRKHKVALVVADTAGKWPLMEDLTADFVYVRLHGDEELYVSGYTEKALNDWARRLRAWRAGAEVADARITAPPIKPRAKGRDVYVYFDNDVKVHAPYDAMSLMDRLKQASKRSAA